MILVSCPAGVDVLSPAVGADVTSSGDTDVLVVRWTVTGRPDWIDCAPAAFSNYYLVRRKVVTQTLSVSGVRTSGGTVRSPSN